MPPTLVTLRVLDGPDRGKVFPNLRPTISIGREEGNTVQLRDDRASRCHAKIYEDAGEVIITDLDSTNGTWVNGEPVRVAPLNNGDRITIGRSLLVVSLLPDPDVETQFVVGQSEQPDSQLPTPPQHVTIEQQERGSSGSLTVPAPTELHDAPPLPEGLTPGQRARLARIFDHLHRLCCPALWHGEAETRGDHVILERGDWEKVLEVASVIARYYRELVEPE